MTEAIQRTKQCDKKVNFRRYVAGNTNVECCREKETWTLRRLTGKKTFMH